jgi:hypothetical protein
MKDHPERISTQDAAALFLMAMGSAQKPFSDEEFAWFEEGEGEGFHEKHELVEEKKPSSRLLMVLVSITSGALLGVAMALLN